MSLVRELVGHRAAVNAVRYSRDGNYCLSCSDDKTVRLWNPHKEDPRATPGSALQISAYEGVHGYGILDVAVASDNGKTVCDACSCEYYMQHALNSE
jgi:mitogen-activated protein kinase organizer 1